MLSFPVRKTRRGSALVVVSFVLASLFSLLAAPRALAGDLIRRDPPLGRLDVRSVVVTSALTEGVLAREAVHVDASVLESPSPTALWLELTPGSRGSPSSARSSMRSTAWSGAAASPTTSRATRASRSRSTTASSSATSRRVP